MLTHDGMNAMNMLYHVHPVDVVVARRKLKKAWRTLEANYARKVAFEIDDNLQWKMRQMYGTTLNPKCLHELDDIRQDHFTQPCR